MNEQLAVVDRPPQAGFQRQAMRRLIGEVAGEEAEGVLAVVLGAIHRRVGVAHQRAGIDRVLGEHAQADAGTDVAFVLVELVAGAQRAEQAFGGQGRLAAVGRFEQDDELVAAESGHRILGTDAVEQPRGRLLEQLVAGDMAERVIDHLEVVEIDEHHAETFARALGARQRQVQAVVEQRPVGQPGQFVVRRQVLDALLRLAHLGDVAEHADVVDHLAVLVLDGVDRQPFEERLAVPAAIPDLTLPDAQPVDAVPHVDVQLGRRFVATQEARLFADDLLAGEPGERGESVIDGQDALLAIGDHDAFGSPIEDHRRQPQAVLGALAGGDVGGLKTEAGDRAVVVDEGKADGQEVARAAGQRQRFLALDSFAQTDRFQLALAEVRTDRFGEQLQIGLADDLSRRKAEGAFELRVGELVASGGVLDRHQRHRVVHHGEQADLRFACRALDFVEAGVVGKEQDDAGDALCVAQQRRDVQRVVAAVGVDDLAVYGVLRVDHLLAVGEQIGHVRR